MSGIDVIRMLNIGLAIISLIMSMKLVLSVPRLSIIGITFSFWMVNIIVFYLSRYFIDLDVATLNLWSSIIRLQGIIATITILGHLLRNHGH